VFVRAPAEHLEQVEQETTQIQPPRDQKIRRQVSPTEHDDDSDHSDLKFSVGDVPVTTEGIGDTTDFKKQGSQFLGNIVRLQSDYDKLKHESKQASERDAETIKSLIRDLDFTQK